MPTPRLLLKHWSKNKWITFQFTSFDLQLVSFTIRLCSRKWISSFFSCTYLERTYTWLDWQSEWSCRSSDWSWKRCDKNDVYQRERLYWLYTSWCIGQHYPSYIICHHISTVSIRHSNYLSCYIFFILHLFEDQKGYSTLIVTKKWKCHMKNL